MTPHISNPLAYIGPGAGFALAQSFLSIVLSILAALASIALWPFRMLSRALRRRRGVGRAHVKKAIFLGLDGFDAAVAEKLMAEGKLPNLARLRETGSYRRLRTTFPALSPVAWSTFATGVNPAKHNIFDFLNRDLRSYVPELSSAKVLPGKRSWHSPFSGTNVEMRRKSQPFWKLLGDHAVNCTILRVPVTFPPEPFDGKLLSAMCTPDLRGTQGEFTLFRPGDDPHDLRPIDGGFEGNLTGPDSMTVPFRMLAEGGCWRLEICGHCEKLEPGEYTPWIHFRFGKSGQSVAGIARFLLTGDAAQPSLYVTPIQIDPEKPGLPISQPGYFSVYLAKLLGSFATLGLAEDTTAYNCGAIDGQAFLKQSALIQQEREAMFFNALDHLREGVVACVFDTSDRVQHMFYRDRAVIERLYADMDRLVGETLRYVDRDTALFVLSDHGFCGFQRGVNLNAWLHQNGYLALESGRTESGEYFLGVDWPRTSAYTFGLGGLYLNLRGREAQGTVAPEDTAALKAELIARLTGLHDGDDGPSAIRRVCASSEILRWSVPRRRAGSNDRLRGWLPRFLGCSVGPRHARHFRGQRQALVRRPLRRSRARPGRAVLQPGDRCYRPRHRGSGADRTPAFRHRAARLDGRRLGHSFCVGSAPRRS